MLRFVSRVPLLVKIGGEEFVYGPCFPNTNIIFQEHEEKFKSDDFLSSLVEEVPGAGPILKAEK
jgi:hypothetical protein